MNTIRIVATVVDTRNLTMYKEDGETVIIPQGDVRLRRILEDATPQLLAQGWADVVLSEPEENSYAQFENESSGAVRFFRVAKAKLKELFNAETKAVEPQVIGVLPVPATSIPSWPPVAAAAPATPVAATPVPVSQDWETEKMDGFNKDDDAQDDQEETFEPVVQVPETKVEQTMSVIDEIMKHAVPASSENFNEEGIVKQRVLAENGVTSNNHPDETAEDTIIAVVDNKVIPGMELIKSQFGRAAQLGSTQGVEKFLQRLGTVIESRSHSVEDLLKFMERADLPIADDGTILIYKVLRKEGDKYVDCHTRKVKQWIGAYVCMDPKLVDHNRNNECSNGLHVARRGYIRSFSGDVCVLAKLAPEDVITVPSYDANKMRVCGYHILKELTSAQYSLLNQNRPITDDPDGKRLLAEAMCGNHTRKTHEVRITGSHGSDVIVTEYAKDVEPAPILTPDAPQEVEALQDTSGQVDVPIQPKDVEQVVAAQATRKEQAQSLYNEWQVAKEKYTPDVADAALGRLVAFKKAAKVGWDRLGIPDPTAKIKSPLDWPESDVTANPKNKADAVKKSKPATPKAPPVKAVLPAASEGSPRERIAKLMAIGIGSTGIAQKVYDIKKASKKAWTQLGVSDADAAAILKAIGKE